MEVGRLFGVLLPLLAAACGALQDGEDALAATTESAVEVGPGIHSFAGPDATLPPDDLAPLVSLIGNAKYIGLGESVHTSGGFYAMKRRVIQHLVEQGVRVLAMETPRTKARAVEHYLQACQGSARDVLAAGAIFPVFADDNTVNLLEWICAFNQAHAADPVHFFGFDAQQADADMSELEAFWPRRRRPIRPRSSRACRRVVRPPRRSIRPEVRCRIRKLSISRARTG